MWVPTPQTSWAGNFSKLHLDPCLGIETRAAQNQKAWGQGMKKFCWWLCSESRNQHSCHLEYENTDRVWTWVIYDHFRETIKWCPVEHKREWYRATCLLSQPPSLVWSHSAVESLTIHFFLPPWTQAPYLNATFFKKHEHGEVGQDGGRVESPSQLSPPDYLDKFQITLKTYKFGLRFKERTAGMLQWEDFMLLSR